MAKSSNKRTARGGFVWVAILLAPYIIEGSIAGVMVLDEAAKKNEIFGICTSKFKKPEDIKHCQEVLWEVRKK